MNTRLKLRDHVQRWGAVLEGPRLGGLDLLEEVERDGAVPALLLGRMAGGTISSHHCVDDPESTISSLLPKKIRLDSTVLERSVREKFFLHSLSSDQFFRATAWGL